ncbi:MAG: outer membrane beta-barrel protein [Bacteroidetes bacterium]|nr:outer membrane beta-barrel protein [Bacteroidota bacterium]
MQHNIKYQAIGSYQNNICSPILGFAFTDTLYKNFLYTAKLYYTSNGYRSNEEFEDNNSKIINNYSYKFHYAVLPIEFKYLFKSKKISINVGAVFSYMLRDTYSQYFFSENKILNQINYQIYGYYNSAPFLNHFDIGAKIGATIYLNKFVALDFSAQKGFINVSKVALSDLGYQININAGVLINFLR